MELGNKTALKGSVSFLEEIQQETSESH